MFERKTLLEIAHALTAIIEKFDQLEAIEESQHQLQFACRDLQDENQRLRNAVLNQELIDKL